MKENTQDKLIIQANEKNLFYKIKEFLKKIFCKINNNDAVEKSKINYQKMDKDSFIEDIKNIENEEIKILKLQKQYRLGKIKEEDLTEEQLNFLCCLYDKQIEKLKKSNEVRKQKILEYKNKLQSNS